jgi:hypothetical protein
MPVEVAVIIILIMHPDVVARAFQNCPFIGEEEWRRWKRRKDLLCLSDSLDSLIH